MDNLYALNNLGVIDLVVFTVQFMVKDIGQ